MTAIGRLQAAGMISLPAICLVSIAGRTEIEFNILICGFEFHEASVGTNLSIPGNFFGRRKCP